MVQKCRKRPNGMSIDEWCQANNINKANYYYRFIQGIKACLDSIPSDSVEHEIIPVPMELIHTESVSTAVDFNSALMDEFFLDISANCMTIRVTEQTSGSLLKKVLGGLLMLNDAICYKQVHSRRKSDRIKDLVGEKDGFLLLYKCLEQGKFVWPRNESELQAIYREENKLAYESAEGHRQLTVKLLVDVYFA